MTHTRFLLPLACLPLLLGVISRPANAAPIPVDRVVQQLQSQTNLPIWMPDAVPAMDRVYANVSVDSPDSYYINFDYTSDCDGSTPCNYGYVSADRNGQFSTPADLNPQVRPGIPPDEIVAVRFDNGMSGQFVNTCGAYCMASVEWRLGGVLYTVAIKNGTQAATVALANNVLQGGDRSRQQAQATPPSAIAQAGDQDQVTAVVVRHLSGGTAQPRVMQVRIVGNYALADWLLGENAGGQALLVRDQSSWRLIQSGGGAMDVEYLRGLGVPDDATARSLLGQ